MVQPTMEKEDRGMAERIALEHMKRQTPSRDADGFWLLFDFGHALSMNLLPNRSLKLQIRLLGT